jgi:hypothetical protein
MRRDSAERGDGEKGEVCISEFKYLKNIAVKSSTVLG